MARDFEATCFGPCLGFVVIVAKDDGPYPNAHIFGPLQRISNIHHRVLLFNFGA